jgi:hypothetical protein
LFPRFSIFNKLLFRYLQIK